MRPMRLRKATLVASLLLGALGCESNPDEPKPQNHAPVVFSLLAFPTVIGSGDSTLVTCRATDPDGDILSYTWVTDSRLVIKGKRPNEHVLFDSPSNSQMFYYGTPSPFDTAWVECDVLD